MIKSRRSIRKFMMDKEITDDLIIKILEAGSWAPSGLNNQPWRFIIVKNPKIKKDLADCTKYGKIIKNAPVLIAVFFDQNKGYNRTKDMQAIGACIQNMLISIHAFNLGAVWLGEILNQREQVEKILAVPNSFELQAVLAIGHPTEAEKKNTSSRISLEKITWREKYGNSL
ncbi:MAG: nitroreductase family protein [Candidatus Helarchaeota archaeon]